MHHESCYANTILQDTNQGTNLGVTEGDGETQQPEGDGEEKTTDASTQPDGLPDDTQASLVGSGSDEGDSGAAGEQTMPSDNTAELFEPETAMAALVEVEPYLICGLEEVQGGVRHTHTEECLAEERGLVLTCGFSEEHIHTDECKPVIQEPELVIKPEDIIFSTNGGTATATASGVGFVASVHNDVVAEKNSTQEFFFTIVPKEDYSGIIMPDDTTTVIEGNGDATFNEIMFTEPGTYSFLISQKEGMDNYRCDGRTWEVSVTVSGTAGAPAGAVGGQYDVSAHDVPADANKDGWITEAEVQAVLNQLRVEYPHGSEWGLHTRYPGRPDGKGMGAASACEGFANLVSDRIFGTLPAYYVSLEETRVGDIMDDGPANHANIVLNDYGKSEYNGTIYPDDYTTVDGNTSGTVFWEMLQHYADWPTGTSRTYIRSRYPAGTNTPSTLSVDTIVYAQGEKTSAETASFINTCLDTPTWSAETKEKARKIMADMTLEEKVGQLFLLHYPGDGSGTVAQATALIDKYHPGGYLVFASMFENNTTAGVQKKIADTQAASDIPLLFTVDEEGGIAASGNRVVRVSKYPQYGHDPFRSPQELKAAGGLAAVAADAVDKANFLANLGLNVNHAPVADVAGPGGMMYGRTWGGDGLENAKYVETLVEASEGAGMPTTLKHFPGYGGTSSDTHNGFAVNDLSLEDFYYNDLLPFHAGIAAGSRAVMVTHNTINCLDTANPASLSPAVYNMLRDEMYFDGVAMTDDLAMKAITNFTGAGQASLRALQAGADMAMTATPDQDIPVALAAARNGSFALSDIETKCMRVLCWKLDLGLIEDEPTPPTPPAPVDYEAKYISKDGMTEQTGSFADMWALAVKSGGKVELYEDTSFASGLSVPDGKSIELDLMGHTLTYTGTRDAINVFAGAAFTLSDSAGEIMKTPLAAPSADTVCSNRSLVYNEAEKAGAAIAETGYSVDFSQSGALVGSGASSLIYMAGGTFSLSGGVLENKNGAHAVFSEHNTANAVNMTGGAILNSGIPSGTNRGGGINLAGGAFNMTGGYIAGNTGVTTGGGVFLDGAAAANITGGVIAGNTGGVNGGGIYASSNSTLSVRDAVITSNTAHGHGGNIYGVSATITLDGSAAVTHGKADGCGGGIYGWGTTSVTAKGDALISDNQAMNAGGGICLGLAASSTGAVNLRDSAWVVGNTAGNTAGGVYDDSPKPIGVQGSVRVAGNTAGGAASNIYLGSSQTLQVTAPLEDGAEIMVTTASTAPSILVAVPRSGVTLTEADAARFGSDNHSYESSFDKGSVYFVTAENASIPVLVMLDGKPYEVSVIDALYQDTAGSTGKYIALNDIAPGLAEFGFSLADYSGSFVLGLQLSDGAPITVYGYEPVKVGGTWRIPVPADVDFSQAKAYFLPNGAFTGEHTADEITQGNGYWSVKVVDMYGTTTEGVTDMSSTQYVPAGRSVTLTLPTREHPWLWQISEHTDADFVSEVAEAGGTTTIKLSNIHAPVVVTCGSAGDSRFTAQYFATTTTLDLQNMSFPTPKDAAIAGYLPVIDTSGGVLPKNGITQARKYMEVLDDGAVKTTTQTKRVYEDKNYVYSQAPSLVYVDRLYTDNHYDLVELWVLKQGCNPESLARQDWNIYNKNELGLSSIHDLHLTNSPDFAIPNDTIYIGEGTVVRFVYEPSSEVRGAPVTFYDYDITDGSVYNSYSAIPNGPTATSQQDTLSTTYANTVKQGINSVDNYDGDGAHLAFGNMNTGNGWDTDFTKEIFNNGGYGNTLNQGNRIETNPSLCTFGLVTGLDANGHIVYAPGVVAPKLFNDGDALGKTAIDGYALSFNRNGDTYTLTGVSGTNATQLDKFSNPQCGTSAPYTHIWTNNFWPMDSAATFGADGHDLKFGDVSKKTNRLFGDSVWKAFPVSDDGLDHNAYFGMNFSVNFVLPEGYLGDLEYCFFGDDDMWVFLDGRLILDIGGVHSSVGEYVNLWDYIEKGDTANHTLQFFYTERGASGSTCWMHFTIPEARFATDPFETRDGSLKVQKSVVGYPDGGAREYKFNVSILNADGTQAADDYSYVLYSAAGEIALNGILSKGVGSFTLADGEYAVLPHIKSGAQYIVTEDQYNCETTITIGGREVAGTETSGTIKAGETLNLQFVNNFTGRPILPATGGPGFLFWYSMACAVIFIASTFGYIHLRKTRNFYSKA